MKKNTPFKLSTLINKMANYVQVFEDELEQTKSFLNKKKKEQKEQKETTIPVELGVWQDTPEHEGFYWYTNPQMQQPVLVKICTQPYKPPNPFVVDQGQENGQEQEEELEFSFGDYKNEDEKEENQIGELLMITIYKEKLNSEPGKTDEIVTMSFESFCDTFKDQGWAWLRVWHPKQPTPEVFQALH